VGAGTTSERGRWGGKNRRESRVEKPALSLPLGDPNLLPGKKRGPESSVAKRAAQRSSRRRPPTVEGDSCSPRLQSADPHRQPTDRLSNWTRDRLAHHLVSVYFRSYVLIIPRVPTNCAGGFVVQVIVFPKTEDSFCRPEGNKNSCQASSLFLLLSGAFFQQTTASAAATSFLQQVIDSSPCSVSRFMCVFMFECRLHLHLYLYLFQCW